MAPTWAIETPETIAWEWHGIVARGKALEIRGITGDIRAIPSDSDEVGVTARIDATDTPGGVRIRAFEGENGLVVCAVRQGTDTCVEESAANSCGRIDFEVHVPTGVRLAAHTVNGGIQAHRLTSDVDAATVNGGVSVSTSGTVKASTVNGSIDASLLKPFWSKAPEFSTVNGRISVQIPHQVKASVQAETRNGTVVSSVPGFRGKATEQTLNGQIGGGSGSGSGPMTMRSVNGSIELRQKI